ncbi:MAG TPA: hypothetical protein VFH56_06545 [Acidimicrobiales bacterium]|nr:hypothetical protein [Acidimicrobiales bacterium]
MSTYRAVSDRARAIHGEEPFEADLSAVDEADELAGGHLEIVPRPYRVLVNNYTRGAQGEVVDLPLRVDEERALLAGGIVERADPEPDEPAGNASTEEWRAYALSRGASEEEVDGLGRDDLRDKYAAPKND